MSSIVDNTIFTPNPFASSILGDDNVFDTYLIDKRVGTGVLDQYGGASAAYSLYDLGNKRGTVVETGETVYGDFVTYESDFSAGVDGWSPRTDTTLDGNIDGIGGKDDCARVTANAVISQKHISQGLVTVGASYSITYEIYVPSSNTSIDGVRFQDQAGLYRTNTTPTPDTWTPVSGTFTATQSTFIYFIAIDGGSVNINGDGDVFYIRNVTVTELDTYRTLDVAYHNPAVRLRRDSDNIHKSFPGGAFTQMLNWANELGNPYVGYAYFTEQNPDSEIILTSPITLDASFDWQITMDVMCGEDYGAAGFGLLGGSSANNQVGFWLSTGRNALGLTDDANYFGSLNMGVDMGIGRMHTLTVNYQVGVGVTVQLDDNPASSPNNNFGDITISRIGDSRGREGYRVIKNISITQNGVNTYATDGDGILASNWVDTVGSNDGTPSNLSSYNNEFGQAKATTWYDQSGVQVESVFNETDCSTANGWAQAGNATLTVNYDSGDEGHESVFRIESGDGIAERIQLDDTYTDGTVYRVSFDHRYVTNNAAKGRIFVTATQYGDITPSATWTRHELIWTQVGAGTSLRLYIDNNDGDASDEWLFDNIKVEALDKAHNDAIQTTADSQPKVVDAGVLVTDPNGNYRPLFDGFNDFFDFNLPVSGQPFSIISVSDTQVSATQQGICGDGINVMDFYRATGEHAIYASVTRLGAAYTNGVVYLKTSIFNTIASSISVDGVKTDVSSPGSNGINTGNMYLGRYSNFYLNGGIAGFIVYLDNINANREAIEQSLSNILTTALS